ncbi:rhomboid family intramembrane serine protease [Cellulomonas sp. H30R-01]|uniref:rhomboid family intramembrane serine protease n=1 Tax=Cellulomonas sp. H30R-01 TaxID=2704467 RepID=UPI001EE3B78C|nr:rhomboid family intramembrane serine protease [Cellulomonas sp. H30R-01]
MSYVRCQRCGRPVCPDCQRPAAVGVQCVDCVAEASRGARPVRTALGGRRREGRPVVTFTIIGLCVVSFVLQQVVPGWTARWLFVPVLPDAFGLPVATLEAEPWRFLSAAFLHSPGGVVHLAVNMLALWMIGPYLEQALGRARFVTLYLMSALGGSVAVVLLADALDAWHVGVLGASGAIFGLFGAVLVVMRRLGGDVRGILVVIGLNVVVGFVVSGISWPAHLGGLFTGLALGAAYAYAPVARRRQVAVVAPVVVASVLVGAAWLAYAAVGLV